MRARSEISALLFVETLSSPVGLLDGLAGQRYLDLVTVLFPLCISVLVSRLLALSTASTPWRMIWNWSNAVVQSKLISLYRQALRLRSYANTRCRCRW